MRVINEIPRVLRHLTRYGAMRNMATYPTPYPGIKALSISRADDTLAKDARPKKHPQYRTKMRSIVIPTLTAANYLPSEVYYSSDFHIASHR
jgi:hypothetical protein